MSTAVSSNWEVKTWLYNKYIYDSNVATDAVNPVPSCASKAQFDRIHLKPMLADLALASISTQLKEPASDSSDSEELHAVLSP